VRRHARQDKIGERLYALLYNAWEKSSVRNRRTVGNIPHNFNSYDNDGNYYIALYEEGVIGALLELCVDLRKPEGEEVAAAANHTQYAEGNVYRRFSPDAAEIWVGRVLAPFAFPPAMGK
jgi:hypothetical protein